MHTSDLSLFCRADLGIVFLQRIGLNMLDDLMELGGPKAQNFVPSFMPHMLRLSLSQDMDLR